MFMSPLGVTDTRAVYTPILFFYSLSLLSL